MRRKALRKHTEHTHRTHATVAGHVTIISWHSITTYPDVLLDLISLKAAKNIQFVVGYKHGNLILGWLILLNCQLMYIPIGECGWYEWVGVGWRGGRVVVAAPRCSPSCSRGCHTDRVQNQNLSLSPPLSPTNPDLVTTSVMQLCNPIIHFVKDIGVIFDQSWHNVTESDRRIYSCNCNAEQLHNIPPLSVAFTWLTSL